jgi:DNA-binding NarL/FixJ family response regulator
MRSDNKADIIVFVPASFAGRVNDEALSAAFGARVRAISLVGVATPALAACVDEIGRTYDLTVRQQEVLSGMLPGASNLEISDRLGIAVGTVKTHVEAVLDKTGSKNRQRLGRLVFGDGRAP